MESLSKSPDCKVNYETIGIIGRGEKMDSRLRRSVLRTALRASVGSQARLGANFRFSSTSRPASTKENRLPLSGEGADFLS